MDWEQAELTTEFRQIVDRLEKWTHAAPGWPPFQSVQSLFAEISPRLREMHANLGRVLVVGLVGGTGVGKSTLINALVGREICRTSRSRPTTCRPVVVCHGDVDPSFLRFGAEEFELHRLDTPLIKEMVLVDCPDPDTQREPVTENRDQQILPANSEPPPDAALVAQNRNLEILRQVLPHCDVILYVASQEKYKQEAVQQEVLAHARGASVLFVQSRADTDNDIRDDWKATLEQAGFSVPSQFFLDGRAALDCQLCGDEAPAEFKRLRECLQVDIAHRARHRIKRSNALDLLSHLAERIEDEIQRHMPAVATLEGKIADWRCKIFRGVQEHMCDQLKAARSLWHERLKKQLIRSWGGGLFIGIARLSVGFGSVLNLWTRVRTPLQLLLGGDVQAGKILGDLAGRQNDSGTWITSADFGISEGDLAQARSELRGYARDAEIIDLEGAHGKNSEQQAMQLQAMVRMLYGEIEAGLDRAVAGRVSDKAGRFTRLTVETLFTSLLAYLVFLLGRNFFYDVPWLGKPLAGLNFLTYSVFWVVAWGWLLHWFLMRRLCRGFEHEIDRLVVDLRSHKIITSLFADLESPCDEIQDHTKRICPIADKIAEVRRRFDQIEDVGVGKLRDGWPRVATGTQLVLTKWRGLR